MTFAAMQYSSLSAFNPVKLVESLKLRATEQQDAQEYVAYYASCCVAISDKPCLPDSLSSSWRISIRSSRSNRVLSSSRSFPIRWDAMEHVILRKAS